jgi:hypothetical protein
MTPLGDAVLVWGEHDVVPICVVSAYGRYGLGSVDRCGSGDCGEAGESSDNQRYVPVCSVW